MSVNVSQCFWFSCDSLTVSPPCSQTNVTGSKFTPPSGGSAALHTLTKTLTHPHTHRFILHTLQCCSHVLSLDGDHSETKASVLTLSSISRSRGGKEENIVTKCTIYQISVCLAWFRQDRFSVKAIGSVCTPKWLLVVVTASLIHIRHKQISI